MTERTQRILLDAVSSVDERYVDEATEERVEYSARIGRGVRRPSQKKLLAIAASILIIVSVSLTLILTLGNTKQVPVYEGMTVSGDLSGALESVWSTSEGKYISYAEYLSDTERHGVGNRKPSYEEKRPIGDAAGEHFGVAAGAELYYAKPGEDIYVTVHVNNPDNFEILSFTLNGEKYSSYMFEEGSDMEHLILKVNVGDASGIVPYTIDAIKYVDGEKIKDVEMRGDKTVNIGVYNENQPTATATGTTVTLDSISTTVGVNDPEGLISAVGGKIYAVLYNGEAIVESIPLNAGEAKDVTFTSLAEGGTYKLAVIAIFDAYDGNGNTAHVLWETVFSTSPEVGIEIGSVSGGSVIFEVSYFNTVSTVTGIELLCDGNVVASSDTVIDRFDGIPSGKLALRVRYTYEKGGSTFDEVSEVEFWSSAGMLPIKGKVVCSYSADIPVLYPMGELKIHMATDLVPTGDDLNVYSISSGTVTDVVPNPGVRMNKVTVTDSEGYQYSYCSLEQIYVSVGDTVNIGDVIATIGITELIDVTEGRMLHFELRSPEGALIRPEFDVEDVATALDRINEVGEKNRPVWDVVHLIRGTGTVRYPLIFDPIYDDVTMHLVGGGDNIVIERGDAVGAYELVCDMSSITERTHTSLVITLYLGGWMTELSVELVLDSSELKENTLSPTTPAEGTAYGLALYDKLIGERYGTSLTVDKSNMIEYFIEYTDPECDEFYLYYFTNSGRKQYAAVERSEDGRLVLLFLDNTEANKEKFTAFTYDGELETFIYTAEDGSRYFFGGYTLTGTTTSSRSAGVYSCDLLTSPEEGREYSVLHFVTLPVTEEETE